MNTDKAYLFGLIIGGGIWRNNEDGFIIHLPYRKWGSYDQNPRRASQISGDIVQFLNPLFRNIYGLNISFDGTARGDWNILFEGDLTELKSDLQSYGIECEGELRSTASIGGIIADLFDENMKRRFIAGLADTIGSTNKNHRRFSAEIQTLSFELKGFNFSFVCELCRLLYSVNCLPDQILWNHPNFQSASDSYYTKWNKGTKLRIQLDQYAKFGAFAFKTKAESSIENRSLQQQTHSAVSCPEREIRAKTSCFHPGENDKRLPDCIRGGHYLHNRHVCAVMGCENAPYDTIRGLFSNVGDLIIPFPILCKNTIQKIEEIIKEEPLLANREYSIANVSVKSLYELYKADHNALLFGNNANNGYPIAKIIQGISYVIADENELNGARPKGNFEKIVEHRIHHEMNNKYPNILSRFEVQESNFIIAENTEGVSYTVNADELNKHPKNKSLIDLGRDLSTATGLMVEFRKPDLLTPLVITGNGRGVLIGAHNPSVYEKLVTIAPDNEYKLCVRPITEGDLRNAK